MSRPRPHSDVRIRTYLLANGRMRVRLSGMRSGIVEEGESSPITLFVCFEIMLLWLRGARRLQVEP